MRNTKNAFTLVELIVVITILAILGTIAFISLQGYSADARNSKRTSDLGNIQSSVSLKQVEGVPLLSFVVADANSEINPIALGGVAAADQAKYAAGTPSYTVLNVAEKDFKDPNDKAYRIAVTEERGGAFQVTATMESNGTDTAAVNGTYVARGTATGSITVDGTTVTVADAQANFFKAGDTITLAPTTGTTTVTKVSRDGVTLTVAAAAATDTTISLAVAEEAGLILGTDASSNTGVVVNNGTTYLAY